MQRTWWLLWKPFWKIRNFVVCFFIYPFLDLFNLLKQKSHRWLCEKIGFQSRFKKKKANDVTVINVNFYSLYWIKSTHPKILTSFETKFPKVCITSITPLVRTLLCEIHKEVCHEKFWQASTARSYFDKKCPSFTVNLECMSICPVSNIKFWCLWFRTKIDNSGKLSDKNRKIPPCDSSALRWMFWISTAKNKMSQRFTVIKASEESPIGEGSDSYGTVKNGQIAGE